MPRWPFLNVDSIYWFDQRVTSKNWLEPDQRLKHPLGHESLPVLSALNRMRNIFLSKSSLPFVRFFYVGVLRSPNTCLDKKIPISFPPLIQWICASSRRFLMWKWTSYGMTHSFDERTDSFTRLSDVSLRWIHAAGRFLYCCFCSNLELALNFVSLVLRKWLPSVHQHRVVSSSEWVTRWWKRRSGCAWIYQ